MQPTRTECAPKAITLGRLSTTKTLIPKHVSSRDITEVVYTPESALRRPGFMAMAMWRDVRDSRELAWRLFLRDIRAEYRKSFLGYFWVIGPPLASTMLFVFLRSQKILNVSQTTVPFPVFVLLGMVLWESFAISLTSPITTVTKASQIITKLDFPREALILSGIYQVLFGICVKLLLLLPVFAWFGVMPGWTAVLAPLGLASLMLLGLVLGMFLLPIGLLYQDIGRGLAVVSGAWMLLTPVVYPPRTAWPGSLLNYVNPVSPLVTTTRELVLGEPLSQLPLFAVVVVMSIVGLFVAWTLFRLATPHVVARMSS